MKPGGARENHPKMSKFLNKPLPLFITVMLAYSIVYLMLVRDIDAVQLVDYWGHLKFAKNLALSDLKTLLHPFYPVGYFTILRLGLDSGLDIVRYGQFWSWIGSLLCIGGVFGILFQSTKNTFFGLLGIVLLIAHPFFRFHAMREGTDILAAGLQLIALYFLVRTAESGSRRWIVAAGIGFGLAYLIRYTSLVMLPVGLSYLWLRDRRFDRRFLLDILALIIPFSLIISPQLIISLQVKGTPFYNRLAKNIWFGIYGNFDWPENWAKIPSGITLIQIIQNDPLSFLGHLAKEFGRIFWYDPGANLEPIEIERNVSLWNPLLVHILWLASCIALWWDKRISLSQKFLLAAALFIPVLAASMAWLFTRFLLVALCLQVVLIVLAFTQLGKRQQLIRHKPAVSAIIIGTTLAIFLLSTNWHQKEERVREVTQAIRELNPILTVAGATHTSDVISNNRLFQTTTQSNHDKYENFNSYGNDPSLPVSHFLEKILSEKDSHYLIFDWTSHAIRTFDYQAYRDQLIQAKSQLVPISLSADHSVYCLYPCNLEEMNLTPREATENIQLLGYNAYLSQAGNVQGIYLYWLVNSTISEDYRFDVQLLDNSGNVLFQRDHRPHQGTYLTESWDVEKPVVDFFFLAAGSLSPEQEYELVIQLIGRDGDKSIPLSIPIRFSDISAG